MAIAAAKRAIASTDAHLADLGEYADVGVQALFVGHDGRLGFAAALAVEPNILLLDEVLAVGDYALSEESRRADASRGEMHGHPRRADLDALPAFCRRAIRSTRAPCGGTAPAATSSPRISRRTDRGARPLTLSSEIRGYSETHCGAPGRMRLARRRRRATVQRRRRDGSDDAVVEQSPDLGKVELVQGQR